jgi:uncharacterized protein (TIGR03435 family)
MLEKTPRLVLLATCRVLISATAVLIFASPAHAQLAHEGPAKAIALSKSLPAYDVVSIKQNKSEEQNWGMGLHDDTFTATNVPLKAVIQFAYDIKADLIVGMNGPVDSINFDIRAKVLSPDGGPPKKFTDQQLQAMIIPLLADRFALKAHLEPKTLSVYDLVVTNGGPKIKLDETERTGSGWNINGESYSKVLTGKSDSMSDLADVLSDLAGRKVIDRTGLKGSADITLKWSDDLAAEQGSNTISIFTALEEQLGLKLVPSKGPVDTLVIDHVEMPTEN